MDAWVNYLIVLAIGASPILEVRGAVIFGLGMGLNPWMTLALGIIGNIAALPVAFWVLQHAHFREFMFGLFRKTAEKHMHKNKNFELYEELALFAFVAIPLPITGCYLGVLISEILGWNWKRSFLAISAGTVVSGLLMLLGAEGVIKLVNFAT
ncbi:MAG TPA: small multi-drug export protein [Nanoarchaeota archaeon]|nr:small multi-drug export protein [Nanoarchaeota archaeon]